MTAQTVTTKNNSSIAQNNRSRILGRPGRWKKIPVLPYLLILPEIIKMLLGLLFIAPQLIGILFSFQSEQELGTYPLHLLSNAPTLQNYLEVIKAVPLFSYLLNSGIVCLVLMSRDHELHNNSEPASDEYLRRTGGYFTDFGNVYFPDA